MVLVVPKLLSVSVRVVPERLNVASVFEAAPSTVAAVEKEYAMKFARAGLLRAVHSSSPTSRGP